MKWSATEGSLPTISSAGQIAVARVAGAIEQELDLVGEERLAKGSSGEALLVRTIPVHGALRQAPGPGPRCVEGDSVPVPGLDCDPRRGLPRRAGQVGQFEFHPVAMGLTIVIGYHGEPCLRCWQHAVEWASSSGRW